MSIPKTPMADSTQPAAVSVSNQPGRIMRCLITNSFPLSLIRRQVVVKPISLALLRQELQDNGLVSIWGHENTLPLVNELTGFDLTPVEACAEVVLDNDNFPEFLNEHFTRVFVLCPELPPGSRSVTDQKIILARIKGWQALLIDFDPA